MHKVKAKSSNVDSVGHDGVNTMRVLFHHGKPYDYTPVTSQQAQNVYEAASPGTVLNNLGIKGTLVPPTIKEK